MAEDGGSRSPAGDKDSGGHGSAGLASRPAVVMAETEAGRPAVVAAEDETGLPEVVVAEDKAGRPDMDAPEDGARRRTCT